MSNLSKKQPMIINGDKYLGEAVSDLLCLTYKIWSSTPERQIYIASYRASRDAFLCTLDEEVMDKIAAWLWEQGINRPTRELVVAILLEGFHTRFEITPTDVELNETMGELWSANLRQEQREITVKILLDSQLKDQLEDRARFKQRGEAEKRLTQPVAEKIRGRSNKSVTSDKRLGVEHEGSEGHNRRAGLFAPSDPPYAISTVPAFPLSQYSTKDKAVSTSSAVLISQEESDDFRGSGTRVEGRRDGRDTAGSKHDLGNDGSEPETGENSGKNKRQKRQLARRSRPGSRVGRGSRGDGSGGR